MVNDYLTVLRDADAEIEVKRSRFLCQVRRVRTEDEARAVIDAARSRFWDARHHCSAFVLEPDASIARSSDDGEPSGTAGMPMLDVLRGRGLTEVVAVVTRWFGGTLLGTGGLVKAYSEATARAIALAGVLRRELLGTYALALNHALAARVESELRSRGVPVLDVSYAHEATLTLGIGADALAGVASVVAELTAGQAELYRTGERWV